MTLNEKLRHFQQHLSSVMSFDQTNQLVDIVPKYTKDRPVDGFFRCSKSNEHLDVFCNKPVMNSICEYFGLSFDSIINMTSSIAKELANCKLICYDAYEKSLVNFPSVNEMAIPVKVTELNKFDRKTLFSPADIATFEKIFFSININFKEVPKITINIDVILQFGQLIRLEITKKIDTEQALRISTLSTITSVGRSRKKYTKVTEEQAVRQMKRYAQRRLRVTISKLLKIEKKEISLQDPINLQHYITLAEMSLI